MHFCTNAQAAAGGIPVLTLEDLRNLAIQAQSHQSSQRKRVDAVAEAPEGQP